MEVPKNGSPGEITVYAHPSKLTLAPFGTIYKVMGDHDECAIYMQMSGEPGTANWQPVGKFLERVCRRFIHDHNFIKICIQIYLVGDDESWLKLSKFIKDSTWQNLETWNK